MKISRYSALLICLMAFPLLLHAQSSTMVSKMLSKGMKSAMKSSIPVPGLDAAMAGEKGVGLSESVSSAINDAMKAAKKSGMFSLDGFTADQIAEIASSEEPFSQILSMKGNNVYKDFSNLIGENLESAGAADLVGDMTGVPGFEMPSGGKEGFIRSVTDNTLAALNQEGSKFLQDIDM